MCTGIGLKSTDGNWFWGRTQEYAMNEFNNAIIIPRNMTIDITLSSFKTKHAVAAINSFDAEILMDGVNEFGLAGGSFAFGDCNHYASEDDIKKTTKIPFRAEEIVTYVLTNYTSVAEIKENINQDIVVSDTANILGQTLSQHYVFQDTTGASVVVEPSIPGEFKLYDNPVHVFTNQPNFDWHLTNLQNYVGLSKYPAKDIQIDDLAVKNIGLGSGLRGVPSDYTPVSRFVRATYLKYFADEVNDQKSIDLIFHILNTSDIVKGVDIELNGSDHYTLYTSAYDLTKKDLYVHNYDNRMIQKISLTDDLINSDHVHYFKLVKEQQYQTMDEYTPINIKDVLAKLNMTSDELASFAKKNAAKLSELLSTDSDSVIKMLQTDPNKLITTLNSK